MIADEGDEKALLAHQTFQAVTGAVRVEQGEGRCLPVEIADRGVEKHVFLQVGGPEIGIPAFRLNLGAGFVKSLPLL